MEYVFFIKEKKGVSFFLISQEITYNTITSKPSTVVGGSKYFVYTLYAILGTWFSGSRNLLRLYDSSKHVDT